MDQPKMGMLSKGKLSTMRLKHTSITTPPKYKLGQEIQQSIGDTKHIQIDREKEDEANQVIENIEEDTPSDLIKEKDLKRKELEKYAREKDEIIARPKNEKDEI